MLKSVAARLVVTGFGIAIIAAGIALYIAYLGREPPTVQASQIGTTAHLTLRTEAAVGPQGGNHSWVSYLVRNTKGEWIHSTVFKVPAHSLVHFTIYQFDGDSGLRNPFLAQVHGTLGNTMQVDGKTMKTINPEEASHTFAIPQLGVIVPLLGVEEEAKNPCEEGPCSLKQAHHTITFTIRTGAPGRYRWQCFVPCAAGFIYGFGGPMQTIGYMDGFLQVV